MDDNLRSRYHQEKLYFSKRFTNLLNFVRFVKPSADPGIVSDALGNTVKYDYDLGQRLTAITDPLGQQTQMDYDIQGRIAAVHAPLQQLTRLTYDNQDNLNKVTDPIGVVTTFAHDDLGRTVMEISPDRGELDYEQDLASQLTQQRDAEQRTSKYQYNAAGRLQQDHYAKQDTVSLAYDDHGRLHSLTEPWGELTTGYTAFSEVNTLIQQYRGGPRFTQHYRYDTAGRLTAHTLPSGRTVTYLYKNGDLISIDLDGQAILNDMTTHGTGRLAEATYGNGLPYKMAFDKAGRPTQQQRGPQSVQYSYDKNGNITRQGNTQYDYDALGRLTAANDPQFHKIAYDYDANGNRLSLTTNKETIPYRYAKGTNRLVGMGKDKIAYDATGRRSEDTNFTYTYNARGRLESITNKGNGKVTRYYYRLDGLRVSKTTGNSTTFYVYDASQRLVAESDNKGDIQKEYIWLGLMPLAVIENNSAYYIHADHLGTPRIAKDTNKSVVWQWRSTPFGQGKPREIGLVLNLRFPGQYYDDESGLHYNWWRYYEPSTIRYLRTDDYGILSGLNRFIYGSNNPITYTDFWTSQLSLDTF